MSSYNQNNNSKSKKRSYRRPVKAKMYRSVGFKRAVENVIRLEYKYKVLSIAKIEVPTVTGLDVNLSSLASLAS